MGRKHPDVFGGSRPRKGRKFGENTIRYYPICLWCGRTFGAKRPDAKTCGSAHRVALKRYVDEHGGPPMFPFGCVRIEKGDKQK